MLYIYIKQDNIRQIEAERKTWNNKLDHMVK